MGFLKLTTGRVRLWRWSAGLQARWRRKAQVCHGRGHFSTGRKTGWIAAIFLGSSVALAGCNLAPHYVRPQGAIPLALPQGGPYPAAPSDAPDLSKIGWRSFFTDPKLRDVIALGLDNNRDLRLAAANVLQARAQYRVQRADQLPTINASGSASRAHSRRAGCSCCRRRTARRCRGWR